MGVTISFADCELDLARREFKRGAEAIPLEPQVFDLLVYLIDHRDRVVSKDDLIEGVWGGRIVSDSALSSRISIVRKAIGDDGGAQRLIRTVPRKGLRFVGEVRATPPDYPPISSQRQEVHFSLSADGTRIAYATVGAGPPLLKAANWLNHLEYDWQSKACSHVLRELAAHNRLVRYDERGTGLSDWEVDRISFEALVEDLESVVEASGLESFPLLGISQGCAVSVAYAAKHPERVSKLVLYGGYARGRRRRGSQQQIEEADAVVTLMRQGWGRENPAFRQLFTSLFVPGGSPEQMNWFNDLQRKTTTPENAVRLRMVFDEIDVTQLLPQVKVPTLVLHCRDDAMVPFDEGRRLAAGIPGARFVALEGRNHLILKSDPSWPQFLDEMGNFLSK
jgi:pimeloyl-ACP methyl ester carboxylesterase/DNA-binding winged helix-turn-helix (wHTH) protein